MGEENYLPQPDQFEALEDRVMNRVHELFDELRAELFTPEKYLTGKEVRQLLGLSAKTLLKRRREGKILFEYNGSRIVYKREYILNLLKNGGKL